MPDTSSSPYPDGTNQTSREAWEAFASRADDAANYARSVANMSRAASGDPAFRAGQALLSELQVALDRVHLAHVGEAARAAGMAPVDEGASLATQPDTYVPASFLNAVLLAGTRGLKWVAPSHLSGLHDRMRRHAVERDAAHAREMRRFRQREWLHLGLVVAATAGFADAAVSHDMPRAQLFGMTAAGLLVFYLINRNLAAKLPPMTEADRALDRADRSRRWRRRGFAMALVLIFSVGVGFGGLLGETLMTEQLKQQLPQLCSGLFSAPGSTP